METSHNIKIQDKLPRKEEHLQHREVKIMGNMGSNNNNHMVDNKLKVMDNKWEILMVLLNNINNHIIHNKHKDMDKVMGKVMGRDKECNSSKDIIHTVWVIKIRWDSLDKSKCHIMELHHNHNLMDLPDKKIHLRMLKHEKYLLEVLVVQLSKTFTIISRNLDQLKIMLFREIQ